MDPQAVTSFMKEHAAGGEEAFKKRFPGAFLLIRFRGSSPSLVYLPPDEGFSIVCGSDEDADLSFETDQTLEPKHAVFAYHTGFRGWTIQDDGTSFGTEVAGEKVTKGRPLMLQDKCKIKLGGGLTEVQFYLATTLWQRMSKAGITKSMKAAKDEPRDEGPSDSSTDGPSS